jgi:DNA-binding response OmpR family regulator
MTMPHLLVIDDEPQICRTLGRAFSRDFVVKCVPDAETALALIDEGVEEHVALFDIVLCDLGLPKMSGQDFYEALTRRSHELVARTVFLSGAIPSSDDAFAAALADRCFLKPCMMADLIATLRRLAYPRMSTPWTAPLVAA